MAGITHDLPGICHLLTPPAESLVSQPQDRDGRLRGLWEEWQAAAATDETCAIAITDANELTATIHNRQPVILVDEDWGACSTRSSRVATTWRACSCRFRRTG